MRLVELTSENVQDVAHLMAESARAGDLILFPTDTVYGLGGIAFSRRVMEKLRKVKPERNTKPTAVLIDNIIRMSQCAGEVPSRRIVALAEAFWPGPLTLVWKTSNAIPEEFQSADRSLGYRVPNSPLLLAALGELESPLWATSANLPGQPAPRMFSEVKQVVTDACDLVIQTRQLLTGRSSALVDVRGRDALVLRESSIREEDIRQLWKSA
jgi:L-threonylcarbamoyladenylate synthase